MTVTLGVGLAPDGDCAALAGVAREIEALGYDDLWVNDDRLQRDVFTLLAAFATETERVRLGPGVTNPYSRHPALIATAVATLDELSGGRTILGLGSGGTNHRALGIERRAPAAALREAVTLIRGLLAGETVTVDGQVVRARDAKLDFAAPRPGLPIHIGARGPRILELGGELADGVIVGNVATETGWRYALERVGAGAERAGRALGDVALTAWMYCSLDDDGDAAIDAVRPMVATSLVTSRPVLEHLGIEMPGAFADAMERCGWSLAHEHVAAAGRLLEPDLIRRFAVAGSPADCRRQLAALLEAFPQIGGVAIVPFANARASLRDVIGSFADQVARPAVAWREEALRP